MQKNLTITFNHPAAISNTIRYGRIDNTVSPVYATITGITSSPYIIQNVANGQYRIYIRPIYADGRACPETSYDTPACTGIQALSVIFDGANFIVSYTASVDVPKVQVNISYPNGGSSSQQFTNDGNDITIAPPSGLEGTYFITMQPVCDEDTGWLGSPTAPVSVEVTESP